MEDYPRSLAEASERARRRSMLDLPHVQSLTHYVRMLRERGLGEVPDFDPLDGGMEARVLFLFEKPGPQAAGSGFISRNNGDSTADNTFRFMQEAKIGRRLSCLWNVIPGWNGTRKVNGKELTMGIGCLERLFLLMPKLAVIVLVGLKAQRAMPLLQGRQVHILSSFHPSPINRAAAPEKWRSIPTEWARVHAYL